MQKIKNFLIRKLGGVTPYDYARTLSKHYDRLDEMRSARRDSELAMQAAFEKQLARQQREIGYLKGVAGPVYSDAGIRLL